MKHANTEDNAVTTASLYIAGVWRPHRRDIPVLNPATGEEVGGIPKATQSELNEAVSAARDAFGDWSHPAKWPWVRRAEVIDDWVQLIKRDVERIARIITLESGKHINEARADVIEGIHMLQYCAGMGRQPIGAKFSSEIGEKESETHRVSRGVCTVITPWNFPFAIPTWLIGPALVCGNTVVFKPSEETPLTAHALVELFAHIAEKHNVPSGVLNLVQGDGEAGEYLVRHPDTVGQLFTGSYTVGANIKQIAAAHQNKFAVCEMGGKNALIVAKDADLTLAVNAAILSAYKTTHQRCVSADLIVVDAAIEPEFTERFLKTTQRVVFGDPFDEKNVFSGPLINAQAAAKYRDTAKRLQEECDETLLVGGEVKRNFVKPAVYRMRHRSDTYALREEFFTPHVVIVPVAGFDEALFVANDHEYGLSQALITRDYAKMREFKIRSTAGLKYVNLPTIGAEVHLPFGGLRRSGTGMPSAAWLFNYLCHDTAFTVNYGTEIKLAQGLSASV